VSGVVPPRRAGPLGGKGITFLFEGIPLQLGRIPFQLLRQLARCALVRFGSYPTRQLTSALDCLPQLERGGRATTGVPRVNEPACRKMYCQHEHDDGSNGYTQDDDQYLMHGNRLPMS
jgi:hypothetical protein